MNKKHHGGPAPVPPGNRPHAGPAVGPDAGDVTAPGGAGAGFDEQDPQRRLGGYGSAGEHPIQQPGGLNDGASSRR